MNYKLKKGLTLWFTGLSGAGKSTVANALIGKLSKNNKKFPLGIYENSNMRVLFWKSFEKSFTFFILLLFELLRRVFNKIKSTKNLK